AGRPGPRPGGAADGVDDQGPVRRVVPVKLGGGGEAGVNRADGDPSLVEEVDDAHRWRPLAASPDQRHVTLARVDRREGVVAADEADGVPRAALEPGDRALGPRVG